MVAFEGPLHFARAETTSVSGQNTAWILGHETDQIRGSDGKPQVSEQIAVSHMQALEDIGYRTVGTEEALAGEEYVLDQVNQIASRCKHLECEVAVQKGSGYHS